ncbi:D-aminoacyl-tRNA deacylase [Moheibacter sediminis]|uniref:D-aminoacyl-tRNA deacylase n=1 Tax=Moheibacter sediminis TaxID=1434700 RepID=A0A1W2CVL0_9FLAO|nr:D-aminoacyl-tRNA deacylase [Moheibacter sediminis]SMC88758.1 D-tyrosyl-tRNA(Tyr) deacylase [Moheibacter sediminis]
MRVVIQRVQHASVTVEGNVIGKIEKGLLVLAGFEENDTNEDFEWIANKIIQLRIFNDENGVMNVSVQNVEGDLLVVSQFTLHASTKKGNRPSYIKSSPPNIAKNQYHEFVRVLQNKYLRPIKIGEFGADMKVELLNDGPVTICIDSKNRE